MAHSQYFGAADLNDDDELRPLEFTLDTPVGPGPYSSALQNIFSRHCAEIRLQSDTSITSLQQISRKRLRELVTKQNNELFGFLRHPDRTPHPTGIAEAIFRRYGHDIPSLHRGIQPISKELNVDISMNSTMTEFNTQMTRNVQESDGPLTNLASQLKWVLTQYRHLGDEILRLETILTQKMEALDKLHQRMPIISSLSTNDALPDLLDAFGKYLEKTFQDSKIEGTYTQLAEAYKKWNILREIISLQQTITESGSIESVCSICLVDSVAYAVVPCGHTFCSGCSRKMNMNCYLCRGTIREKLKLYFN